MRNTAQIPDQELIHSYIQGNEDALSVIVQRHKQKVYAYIRKLVNDATLAEDLFQDVFVKVIHTLKSGNYNEEGKFLPWVMRIAHNLSIDYFRKEKRLPQVQHQGRDDFDIFRTIRLADDNVEDKMVKEQILRDVKKLIRELPEEQREVIMLRLYEDMSFQEIAEQTNVSINTALGRMRYALINLRKIIKDNSINLDV
jgi:RNA polymerase sigma factor (sigma-70 family)